MSNALFSLNRSDHITITIPADGRLYTVNGMTFLPMLLGLTLTFPRRG